MVCVDSDQEANGIGRGGGQRVQGGAELGHVVVEALAAVAHAAALQLFQGDAEVAVLAEGIQVRVDGLGDEEPAKTCLE